MSNLGVDHALVLAQEDTLLHLTTHGLYQCQHSQLSVPTTFSTKQEYDPWALPSSGTDAASSSAPPGFFPPTFSNTQAYDPWEQDDSAGVGGQKPEGKGSKDKSKTAAVRAFKNDWDCAVCNGFNWSSHCKCFTCSADRTPHCPQAVYVRTSLHNYFRIIPSEMDPGPEGQSSWEMRYP